MMTILLLSPTAALAFTTTLHHPVARVSPRAPLLHLSAPEEAVFLPVAAKSGPMTYLRALQSPGAVTTVPCDEDSEEGCMALCDEDGICEVLAPLGLATRLRVGFYFAVWFALSIGCKSESVRPRFFARHADARARLVTQTQSPTRR